MIRKSCDYSFMSRQCLEKTTVGDFRVESIWLQDAYFYAREKKGNTPTLYTGLRNANIILVPIPFDFGAFIGKTGLCHCKQVDDIVQ